MVRTACRRFVLPARPSRWEIDTVTQVRCPARGGAGDIMPLNNAAERALRCVAVGRRNWTFCGSDRGGERAAAIYTLVATAKLNDIDPEAWLAAEHGPTGEFGQQAWDRSTLSGLAASAVVHE